MNIGLVLPTELDKLELPYIVATRPKISWFEESINKTLTFRKENIEIPILKIENINEIDTKLIRSVYTDVHLETLYTSVKSRQYFKRYMSIIYYQIREILNQKRDIMISIAYPPDLWAGRTFLRKCSLFSLSTYISKRIGEKVAILSIDVHYCIGIQDQVEYERDSGKEIFLISLCSISDISTKIYRKIKKEPWKVLPILIPPGARDDIILAMFDYSLRILDRYEPDSLIILIGLDIFREDLIGEFMASCDLFYDIGRLIAMFLESVHIKKTILLIECVSSRKSIEKAFTNLLAGILGIEKLYYDPISKESSQDVKKLATESITKVGKLLYKFWKVRPGIKIPRI